MTASIVLTVAGSEVLRRCDRSRSLKAETPESPRGEPDGSSGRSLLLAATAAAAVGYEEDPATEDPPPPPPPPWEVEEGGGGGPGALRANEVLLTMLPWSVACMELHPSELASRVWLPLRVRCTMSLGVIGLSESSAGLGVAKEKRKEFWSAYNLFVS